MLALKLILSTFLLSIVLVGLFVVAVPTLVIAAVAMLVWFLVLAVRGKL